MSDFAPAGKDVKIHFMVTCSLGKEPDEAFAKLVPEEVKHIAELRSQGLIMASYIGNPEKPAWHAFLVFRETIAESVQRHLRNFPLAPYLTFEITELRQG